MKEELSLLENHPTSSTMDGLKQLWSLPLETSSNCHLILMRLSLENMRGTDMMVMTHARLGQRRRQEDLIHSFLDNSKKKHTNELTFHV